MIFKKGRRSRSILGQGPKGPHDLYLARGREHGNDVDDWSQAEGELVGISGGGK